MMANFHIWGTFNIEKNQMERERKRGFSIDKDMDNYAVIP